MDKLKPFLCTVEDDDFLFSLANQLADDWEVVKPKLHQLPTGKLPDT